ncbi:ATP-binding protein [Pseudoalteromonas sp. S16_S37]|uniref:ATP-binding protein n=1 Tax=Pseudoalteromonas sp. S16_S37 TaxID=2720228 RepID=UPI00167FFB83|nr:ATP-binding protein [Pseudoalteromonas sp. S16_S37]MBD1582161.1 response regulator [Pseudoalteromonas sp. S16_S37]
MATGELFTIDQLDIVLSRICHVNDSNELFLLLPKLLAPYLQYQACVLLIPDVDESYISHSQSDIVFEHTYWPASQVFTQAKILGGTIVSEPTAELAFSVQAQALMPQLANTLVICLEDSSEHGVFLFTQAKCLIDVEHLVIDTSFRLILKQLCARLIALRKLNLQSEHFYDLLQQTSFQSQLFSELASEWFWRTDKSLMFTQVSSFNEDNEFYTRNFIDRALLAIGNENEQKLQNKWQRFLHLINQHSDFYDFEFELHTEQTTWISLSGKPQYDEQNHYIGYLGIAKDITYAKQRELAYKNAKEKAESANLAKSQFLAVMSHEIRTPMNAILGMVELLNDTDLNEQQRQWLSYAQSSATLLQGLISDVLDFSKIESGILELDLTRVELKTQLKSIAAQFSVRQSELLKFTVKIDEQLPDFIYTDTTRLGQILFNLIGNAFKYTSYGEITFEATLQNGLLLLRVQDTGVGINEEELEHIFQPFTQVGESVKRKQQGVGLGLSITKKIVEAMKGEITCQSKPNEGTVFCVKLPYENAQEQLDSEPKICQLRSLKVLVAEDNPANQVLIRALLEKLGHHVTIADTGSDALNKAKSTTYDLVLMDMMMPVMDGLTATQYMRKEMSLEVPIFALTANAGQDDKEKCLNVGMDKVLTKPIRFSVLQEAISSIFVE